METTAKKQLTDKYFDALIKLHHDLQINDQLSLHVFCSENHLTTRLTVVLQNAGIIKSKCKGRAPRWEWRGIEPTRAMAVKVIKMLTLYRMSRNSLRQPAVQKRLKFTPEAIKKSPEKIENPVKNEKNNLISSGKFENRQKSAKKPQKSTWKFSLLWGLISFRKNQ